MVDVSRCSHPVSRNLVINTPTDDDRNDRDRDTGRHGRRDNRDRDRDRRLPQDDRRGSYQGVPTGPRAEREKGTPSGPSGSGTATPSMPPPSGPNGSHNNNGPASNGTLTPDSSADYTPPMTEDDLTAIRSRYLGVDKKKRKIRKMNDRKFVFDWDEQDDTFANDAPSAVGSQRQGAAVMFGRGHIAGMDDAGTGAVVPARRSGSENNGLQLADALERRKAAKSGLDERHWTEKPLHEMKERDWRIFREDFSIAARGMFLRSVRYCRCLFSPRWSNSSSTKFMEGIYNSRGNS